MDKKINLMHVLFNDGKTRYVPKEGYINVGDYVIVKLARSLGNENELGNLMLGKVVGILDTSADQLFRYGADIMDNKFICEVYDLEEKVRKATEKENEKEEGENEE